MSAAPFMQLYVADYLGDTRHLTTEQHGAYLLLLMTMWRHDGRLPHDESKLARIAGLSVAKWRKISADVMAFFDVIGDEITQKRLAVEITKAKEKSQVRAEAGSAGGHAKALKDQQGVLAIATDLPCHSSDIRDQKDTSSLRSDVVRTRLAKGERLPDDWQPKPAHFSLATSFDRDARWVHQVADTMRDWAKANGHRQAGRKSDWDATFSNFIRKDGASARGSPGRQRSNGWLEAGRQNIDEGMRHEPDFHHDQGHSGFPAGSDRAGAGHRNTPDRQRGGGDRGPLLDLRPLGPDG